MSLSLPHQGRTIVKGWPASMNSSTSLKKKSPISCKSCIWAKKLDKRMEKQPITTVGLSFPDEKPPAEIIVGLGLIKVSNHYPRPTRTGEPNSFAMTGLISYKCTSHGPCIS